MIADAFWLAAGLAVIIKGGDLFVSAASIAPVGIDRAEQLFNMAALLAVMAVVALLIVRRGRISRRAGTGLLVFYAMYLAGLTMLSAAVRP